MEPTVSRRAFVKCALLGALAVSAAAVAGCSADSAPEKLADSSGESTSHNPSRTESCDIVVVGSGMAGICAGARAADLGAHVIVLEQNSSLGGTSTVAEGAAGVNSYIHVRDGIEINVNEAVNRVEEYCHWGANKDVLTRFVTESGATIDWLHDTCGVRFAAATSFPGSYPAWHLLCDEEGKQVTIGPGVIEPLAAFIGDHGGEVRPDNRATGLITEGDAVKGVYVSDGADEYAIEADAVILATGGYSDNQEMFESYSRIPFDRVYGWGIPGRNGDGITWAEQMGAMLHNAGTVMFAASRVSGATMLADKLNMLISFQCMLRVNDKGRRFFNESMYMDFTTISNAILAQVGTFALFDQAWLDSVADELLPVGWELYGFPENAPWPEARDVVDEAVAAGNLVKADTLEQLAERLGIDAAGLKETVERYNSFIESGVDEDFGAVTAMLPPMTQAPFYGGKITAGSYATCGGLYVDENLRVISKNGDPIPGLFALGGDASSIYGNDYDVGVLPGSQQGWCATGGRLAAEFILGA